jgi:tRNA A-37 threonylcarbamoyl transferase component Bud32
VTRPLATVVIVVVLSVMYAVLQVGFVRPHLWPAGHGARVAGDPRFTGGSSANALLLGRPPALDDRMIEATHVEEVMPGSPADLAGLRPGDVIVEELDLRTRQRVNLRNFAASDRQQKMRAWREAYWTGVRDPLTMTVVRPGVPGELRLTVTRPPAWSIGPETSTAWARTHISDLLQIVVFIAISVGLLLLRASNPLAHLAVFALSLSAVAAGGPALGAEYLLPPPLQQLITLFAWTATPVASIATCFAVAYFPKKAAMLDRRPWLLAVPFVVAAPMFVLTTSTALFLVGGDAVLPIVVWDAAHPALYFGSFALAVAMNVAAVAESVTRFRRNADPGERRRIKIAVVTIVPGVLAFAVKEGVPTLGLLLGRDWALPWWMTLALQIVVLLPAIGLAYAVAVHRVFAPATVLRRSVQYAFARKTLALVAMLPAIALATELIKNRDMSISMLIQGSPLFDLVTIAGVIAVIRYRDRARLWLDRRFFREAYDAREILLSLATRVTYETDPEELTALVVNRIDTALHPEMIAVLVAGVDEGQLKPVSVLHGAPAPLGTDSGVVTMLRWSNEPLELYVNDTRSPARRLPTADQEWLRVTKAVLLVPVTSRSELIALIALGAKRSEEPYTTEDRQLLASIAAQMALALDVARLRERDRTTVVSLAESASDGLAECPQCGRCAARGTKVCPDDRTAMNAVPAVPHVIERKYRVDQVIGRGGMGAVYRARDMRLDRDVAIKVVRAGLLDDAETRSRFRREAQIVARLQHPGIVSVFDYGTFPDGSAFLVMELVRGEDLRRVLRREGALPSDRALQLLVATSQAVQAAHREGVLHRDLKPENILVLGDQAQPVKVLDFGVAKVLADKTNEETGIRTLTGTGAILGTPAYMAPEQLRGGTVDARTDVFSLGVIAYEMFTGDLPFGRTSLWDIGRLQAEGMRPMQGSREPVPAHVETAVRRALSLEPGERPASAAEFGALIATTGLTN